MVKYKLKYIDFINIKYNINKKFEGKLIDYTYNGDILEFQTPKIIIENMYNQNGKEYIVLKLSNTEACNLFYSKLLELEMTHNRFAISIHKTFKIKPIFDKDFFTVKVPFHYSKPSIKVYYDNKLFNYYSLQKGMEIICNLTTNKLWISEEITFNLNIKEILIINLNKIL